MADFEEAEDHVAHCPSCGGEGTLITRDTLQCRTCAMMFADNRYEIQGQNPEDVVTVMREIDRHRAAEAERRRLAGQGPWRAGLFYLLVLAVVTVAFMGVAHVVALWAIPVVLGFAIVGVVVIGALQLRQDGKVSEKGLISLVKAALRNARTFGQDAVPK